jgi:hypothetical protein
LALLALAVGYRTPNAPAMTDPQKKRPRGVGDGVGVGPGVVGGWQQQQQQPAGLHGVGGGRVFNVASAAAAAAASTAPAPARAPVVLDLAAIQSEIAARLRGPNVAFLLAQQQQAQQQQAQQAQVMAAAAAQAQMQQQRAAAEAANNNSSINMGHNGTALAGEISGGGLPFGVSEFVARPGTILWTLDDLPLQQQQQQQQQQVYLQQQLQPQQGSAVTVDTVSPQKPAAKKARTSTGSANSTTSSLTENQVPPGGTSTGNEYADEKKAEEGDDKSSSRRYSAEALRTRLMPDGCIVPPIPAERGKDGLYKRPPGRARTCMDWNALFGVWVPEGLSGPTPQTVAALLEARSEHQQAKLRTEQKRLQQQQVQILQQQPQEQEQQSLPRHPVMGLSTVGGAAQAQQQPVAAPIGAAPSADALEQSILWSMDSGTVRRSILDGAVLAAHVVAMKGSMPDPMQAAAVIRPREGDIQIIHATLPPQSLLDIIQELVLKMPDLPDHDIADRVMGRVKAGFRSGAGRFLFRISEPTPQWIVLPDHNAKLYTLEIVKLRRPVICSTGGSNKNAAGADGRNPAASTQPATKRIDDSTPFVDAVVAENLNIPAKTIEEMPVAFAFDIDADGSYDVADAAAAEEDQDEYNAVLAGVRERMKSGGHAARGARSGRGGGRGRGGRGGRGERGGGRVSGRHGSDSGAMRPTTPGSSTGKGTPPKEVYDRPAPDIGPGWRMVGMQRTSGKYKGHVDNYWYTPKTKRKLRSRTECNRFIEALTAADGDEDKAFAMMKKKS